MALFGGKNEVKELEEKLQLLSEENTQLRRKLRLVTGAQPGATLSMNSLGGYASMASRSMAKAPKDDSGQMSIAGLDVAYLIVDKDLRVTQLNHKMAEFIGCEKSVVQQRKPITELDQLEWAPQVFTTLLADSKEAGDNVPADFEASRKNLENGRDEHYHFKAVWSANVGTVTVEDITTLKRTREFFERLVSPNIVTKLLDSGEDPFSVDKRHMTVMFGDLRGFTKFCEAAPPDSVRAVFDEFVALCMESIDRNEATLDKFVGDQVMALFAAPMAHPGHAYQAIRTAVEMQRAMKEVRPNWIQRGLVPQELVATAPDILQLGIGINTGDMTVGMFGSGRSNQYTVLGHHVNLAARLCSNAAGEEILAGMGTLDDVKKYYESNPAGFDLAIKFRAKGNIIVKNVAEPVPVATLAY